jgi:hypothetical protein
MVILSPGAGVSFSRVFFVLAYFASQLFYGMKIQLILLIILLRGMVSFFTLNGIGRIGTFAFIFLSMSF